MTRDFHAPGRSPAYGANGMACTSHPLATLAAIESLKAGGTAADAAVTAAALLTVVEPHMTGIGGDCFVLVGEPDGTVHGFNGSGRAAAAASIDALHAKGVETIAPYSVHTVTVPGAIDAWEKLLERFGKLGIDRALAPAIAAARDGFVVHPRVATDWEGERDRLAADAGAAKHYLVEGRAPLPGDIRRQTALSETLRLIAKRGARGFYRGSVAEDIAATVQAKGGLLQVSDLEAHHGDWVEPISTTYRGAEILEIPPNGQGLAALVLLNILERFELAGLDPNGPERHHIALEAARLAYAVRDTHIADPAFMTTPVAALIDKAFAKTLAEKIDRTTRRPLPAHPTPGSDTIYLTVADRDGRIVSLINSTFHAFGSGIVTEKSGIVLQNRGYCFVMTPGHPNAIGPSKRPMHTIIPGMIRQNGQVTHGFGVMGGAYQAMGHAHVVANLFDFGMDPQAAIDAPRSFFDKETTTVDRHLPAETRIGLNARGHRIHIPEKPIGGGQMIQADRARGVYIGGSDHRKDGFALGW